MSQLPLERSFTFLISVSSSGRYRLALSSVHLHQENKEEKGQIQKSWIQISTMVLGVGGKDCAVHPGCAAHEFPVDEMLPWRSVLSSPLQMQMQHTAMQVLGNTEKCMASVI